MAEWGRDREDLWVGRDATEAPANLGRIVAIGNYTGVTHALRNAGVRVFDRNQLQADVRLCEQYAYAEQEARVS